MAEMELLPLGADLDLIREIQTDVDSLDALKTEHGIKSNNVVVFTGGKLMRRKQIEVLLEAIDCKELAHWVVFIVGEFSRSDTDYKEQIESLAGRIGDRVKLVGWNEQLKVYRFMAISDLAVFPASQSILWLQSIASGLPLVCGDTGDQDPSYCNTHDNIHILKKTDITASVLRSLLIDLNKDAKKVERMKMGAIRVATEMLNWDSLVAQTTRFNTNSAHLIAKPKVVANPAK
jgi:1,2-diacylglycerol 3-alpha-glucosyltransferase